MPPQPPKRPLQSTSASAVCAKGMDDMQAEEVPSKGVVFLDLVEDGVHALTHTLTGETIRLPPGDWAIFYDEDDGMAAVVRGDGGAPGDVRLVQDIFSKSVFQHLRTKELFVQVGRGPGAQVQSLTAMRTKFNAATVDMHMPDTNASFRFKSWVFAHPRGCEQRMYWGLQELYTFMKLESYKGVVSRWIFETSKVIDAFTFECTAQRHFVYGNHGNLSSTKVQELPLYERCLPATACSTLAFMLMTSRMAFAAREKGGLSTDSTRNAARLLFQSLCDFARGAEAFEVMIFLDQKWVCSWPRPSSFLVADCQISVTKDGLLDLDDLLTVATGPGRNKVAFDWVKRLRKSFGRDALSEPVPLVQFFTISVAIFGLRPLLIQLVKALSLRVEAKLFELANQRKPVLARSGFMCRWCAKSEVMEQKKSKALAEYVLSGVQESARWLHTSPCLTVATDKASVCGLALQNCLISFPSNLAIIGVPQVDLSFDPEHAQVAGPVKRRKLQHTSASAGTLQTTRHRAWMLRGREAASSTTWRPQAVFRTSSKKWLSNLDNSLMRSTNLKGIATFFMDPANDTWEPSNWSRWPHLGVAMDLGPDGVCAMHALQRRPGWQANISCWPDPSHGIHKDLDGAIRSVGLQNFWLVLVISLNLVHGPDKDDMRYNQLRETLDAVFDTHNESSCALFVEFAGRMHTELVAGGVQFPQEDSKERELWQWLKQRQSFRKKGRRIQLSRFLGSLKGAQDALMYWSTDCFERTYCALELDFLRGKKFEALVLRGAESAEEGGQTTSTSRLNFEEKTLRSAAANAVALSVMLLSDYNNKRLVEIVCGASKHLLRWHTEQNRRLRSSSESCSWLIEQASGGSMDHIWEGFQYLSSAACLLECGFTMPESTVAPPDFNNEVTTENEFADLLGQFVLSLAFARMRRLLWLTAGWPVQLARILKEDSDEDRRVVAKFQSDWRVFEKLQALPNKTAIEERLISRHLMALTPNIQARLGLSENEWLVTPELRQLIRARQSGMIATQAVEDLFGEQKNSHQVRGSKKYRRPEHALSVGISNQTLSKRHHFSEVEVMAVSSGGSRLPREAFRGRVVDRSAPWQCIVGTDRSVPWWSPSATNMVAPAADLTVLRDAEAAGDLTLCRNCWLGCLFDLRHRFVVNYKNKNSDHHGFYMVGHHLPDSGVLAWPVARRSVPGSPQTFYFDMLPSRFPVVLSIFSLDVQFVEAYPFEWKAWYWQAYNHPRMKKELSRCVRPFQSGKSCSVLELAAKNAWWNLGKAVLAGIAGRYHMDIGAGASLYDTVFKMCRHTLPALSDSDICDLTHARLVNIDRAGEFDQELLAVDAAMEVMDHHDHEVIKTEQRSAKTKAEERTEYATSYKTRKSAFAAAKSSGKQGSRGRSRNSAGSATLKLPPPSTIPHSEAKVYCPATASIWRGLTRGEWCGHQKPYKRCSASWQQHGESGALVVVLRILWQQALELEGKDIQACPVEGLFSAGSDAGL